MAKSSYETLIKEQSKRIEDEIISGDVFFMDREIKNIKESVVPSDSLKNIDRIKSDLKSIRELAGDKLDIIITKYHSDNLSDNEVTRISSDIKNNSLEKLFYDNKAAAAKIILLKLINEYTASGSIDIRTDFLRYFVNIQIDKTVSNILKKDIISFFEEKVNQDLWLNVKNIGYCIGFLLGIKHIELSEVEKYFDHTISSERGKKNLKKEDRYGKLIRLVQDDVKDYYKKGGTKRHNVLAAKYRTKIMNYIKKLKSGENPMQSERENLYGLAIKFIFESFDKIENEDQKWSKIIKDLSYKKRRDFFNGIIRDVAPPKFLTGIKKSS